MPNLVVCFILLNLASFWGTSERIFMKDVFSCWFIYKICIILLKLWSTGVMIFKVNNTIIIHIFFLYQVFQWSHKISMYCNTIWLQVHMKYYVSIILSQDFFVSNHPRRFREYGNYVCFISLNTSIHRNTREFLQDVFSPYKFKKR